MLPYPVSPTLVSLLSWIYCFLPYEYLWRIQEHVPYQRPGEALPLPCPPGAAQCWVKLCAFNLVCFAAFLIPGAFHEQAVLHTPICTEISATLRKGRQGSFPHFSHCRAVPEHRTAAIMEQTLITNQDRWWLMWGCEKLLRARRETSPAPSLPPDLPYGCVQSSSYTQFVISIHSFCKINGIFSLAKPELSIPEHHNSPNCERVRGMGKRETQKSRFRRIPFY